MHSSHVFRNIGQLKITQIDHGLNGIIHQAEQIGATGQGDRLRIVAGQQEQGLVDILRPVVFEQIQQHRFYLCSGSNVNVSTSISPWSVNFSAGMTDSERKLSVIHGCSSLQPSSAAAVSRASNCFTSSAAGSGETSPPNGKGTLARTSPSTTQAKPPPISSRTWAARKISPSFAPATTRLCASCATLEAMAPLRNPKPLTSPRPTLPLAWCRSMTT